MRPIFRQVSLFLFALTLSTTAYASCNNDLTQDFVPLTLKSLEDLATQSVNEALKSTPAPAFFHLPQLTQIEQHGASEPAGLAGLLPQGLSFVPAPAPTSPGPMVVSMTDPKQSVVLHMDLPWHGRTTATTVYASLPEALPFNSGGYLIGPENPVVVFHLHGGGTPSATGKSAMSIGADLAKSKFPTVAIDLPGHGRATRSLEGLTTMEGEVDWILAALKKLVHPKVKVIISGHSWGGEFALYMWLHSNEQKYRDANIARFIALSSPIDVTLGGDQKEKLDFEKWLDEHFDEYESRTAETDFEFKKNVLLNGKISDVGSYFTAFTDFDFRTPLLTAAQQKERLPLTVWVGQHDGLVYVGREDAYNKFGASLTGDNDFYLMPPGRTWASKGEDDLKQTGHGIWDRYVDGTTRHETYQMITDRAIEVANGVQPATAHPDQAWQTLSDFMRTYANFIAFRELAHRNVQYLRRSVGDVSKMNARRSDLYAYVKAGDAKFVNFEKDKESAIRIEADQLRARLGLEKSITVSRAEEELNAVPVTDEQRSVYQAYIEAIDVVDKSMASVFDSQPFEAQLKALESEFRATLDKVGAATVQDYKTAYDKYSAIKNPGKEDAAIRGRLAALHQKFLDANKQNQTRFGTERDRLVSLIPKPDGVNDQGDAIRQLKRDLSPERQAKLREFIEQYALAVLAGEAKAKAALDQALAGLEVPDDVESFEDARLQLSQLGALLDLTLVPNGNEKAQALVDQMKALDANRIAISKGGGDVPGLEKLAKAVKELKDRRKILQSKWDKLWREKSVTSNLIEQKREQQITLLLAYADAYKISEEQKGKGLLALKESGQLTADSALALAQEVDPALTTMLAARDAYLKGVEELEKLMWSEAAAGHLQGATDEARQIATEVADLGPKVKEQDDILEARRRAESLIIQERDLAQWEYLNLMRELGIEMPIRLERVAILSLLTLPTDQLLARLRSDSAALEALQKCLNLWQEYAARIREDDQRKSETIE